MLGEVASKIITELLLNLEYNFKMMFIIYYIGKTVPNIKQKIHWCLIYMYMHSSL